MQLTFSYGGRSLGASPLVEMAAYEALWERFGSSYKALAQEFSKCTTSIPSDLVSEQLIETYLAKIREIRRQKKIDKFGVQVFGLGEYPSSLRDAKYPIEVLYYQGYWNLINTKCIAVVGTRNPTKDGEKRTVKIVKRLVNDGFTVVSGLAKGIDTIAHKTAIDSGGQTIAVIGTPLYMTYPKENAELQNRISKNYLLISQVPFCSYIGKSLNYTRAFFPERNKTMSAISVGSIIIEASDTSGTLIQAKAAIEQGRKLFILDSCFKNPSISWPTKYEKHGAIRVRTYEDMRTHLVQATNTD